MTDTHSHKLFAAVAVTVLSWTSPLLLTRHATAQTPTDKQIAPLIEQLKVADEFNREDTVAALAEVGEPAIPALIKALESENYLIRQGAADALEQIGSPAVPELLKAVESDSPRVRVIAATVLGNISNSNVDSVASALLQLLLQDADPRVRGHAGTSLRRWQRTFSSPREEEVLFKLFKDYFPELTAALKNDPEAEVRSSAASALGYIGVDAKAAVPDLAKALTDDPEAEVRSSAASALWYMGAEAKAAVPVLGKVLQNDPEAEVRSSAASALENMGAEAKAAVPDLVKALQDDPEAYVRRSAASALVSISVSLQERANTLSPTELDRVISDLSAALQTIESDKLYIDKNQISTLRLSLNALQAQKNAHIANLIRQNKWLAGGLFYLVFFLSLWSLLYWLRPRWLLPINDALKPYEFKLPDSLGGAPVKIRDLTFFSLFCNRPRVLDAWVSAHISPIRDHFKTMETVRERRTYITIPVILDRTIVPNLTSDRLRPLFDRPRACLSIVGEGGSGKTSIACQIAHWAMHEHPDDRIAPHLTIPILIEEELNGKLAATAHPLRETIRRQLQDLSQKAQPISEELLANLLKHRRILVILDHISEMSEATRKQIEIESSDINALVITSRLEENLSRATHATIQPLRISGNRLSTFLEDYLKQRGKRDLFTDNEFFTACIQLSTMVGTRDITVLLAKLYAEQLISAKEGYKSGDLPENIPDLMLSYLNELNRDVAEDKLADRTLHQDAKAIAWECLKERYRPASAHIKDAIAVLSAPDADKRLPYLESKLRLLQTVGVAKENLRFALDPVAEYLAGLYLVDKYNSDPTQWQDFLKTADAQSGAPDTIKGFLLAVRDCYLAKIPGAKDSDFLPKEISDRTMTPSAPPQAVAQPVSP